MSETARRAEIPRRTLQYWWDNEAVFPGEVDVARMLRPYVREPIAIIKLLAGVFRDHVLSERYQSAADAEAYGALVAAARAGKPAFLVVHLTGLIGESPNATLYAARDERQLGSLHASLSEAGSTHLSTINLTDCLHGPPPARRKSAKWASDEKERT